MKKGVSLILTLLILLSTATVLTLLPNLSGVAEDNAIPNLITNGDAEGVLVGGALKLKYDETDRGEGHPTNSLLGYTYYYDNGRYLYNPYGWRNNDTRYNYLELDKSNAWPLNDSERFKGFSGEYSFRLNRWSQAMQNVELEENKIYKVSAKVTLRPTTATPAGDWQFDIFLDGGANTTAGGTRPNGADWNLTRGHSVLNEVTAKFNDKSQTFTYSGSTHYYFGDFEEYSFTFNANDFIAANNIEKNTSGKYDARLVIQNYSNLWLMFDSVSITEVIEVKSSAGGTFTGEVENDGSESILTAEAYYGNRFLGWYSTSGQLISSEPIFKGVVSQSMIATFEQFNLLTNGDFEAPNALETATEYNSYPKYSNSVFGFAEVRDNPIADSENVFGKKALAVTPSALTTGNDANAKIKGLISIPVELTAGVDYIWKFSYCFPDVTYVSSKHYLKISVDSPQNNGRPGWASTAAYSFHSQRPELEGVDPWSYSWGAYQQGGGIENQGASSANAWVDVYVILTPSESGKHFLTLGTAQALTDTVFLDNISLTEASKGNSATSVSVDGEGEVFSYRTDEQALRATEARGAETVFQTLESTPYYSQMLVTFTAKAKRGNIFTGWYDQNNKLVSSDNILTTWSTDNKFTAKFITDETMYKVSAVAENNGGFITDDTDETEFYRDDKVTFTAHAYKGNTFAGWYDGETLLSTDPTFTLNIKKNTTLVARFNIHNIFSDSGFENTKSATSLWGDGNHWYTDGNPSATYGDVVSATSKTGNNSLAIRAPYQNIIHKAISVEANKDYHFSLDWRTANAYSDDQISGLAFVKIVDADSGAVLAEDSTFKQSLGSAYWQQAYLNFNSGSATAIKVILSYNAKASAMFIDNLALFRTDKVDFAVSASVEEKDGIFAGYIKSDKLQYVAFGNSVSVSTAPYERNTFEGWLEDGKIVSTDETYTFTADRYRELTAKFQSRNLTADSGFENTEANSDMPKSTWVNFLSNGYFKVKEGGAFDGNRYLEINHKNKEFTYKIEGLSEHKYYVLSFMWKLPSGAKIDAVSAVGARTQLLLAKEENVDADGNWQKFTLYFNTHQDTAFDIKMLYTAQSGVLSIDNLTLYEAHNVLVTAGGGGNVTATHEGAVDTGTTVTATATADNGNTFKGWYDYNSPKTLLSTDASYTFTVGTDVSEIIAYFDGPTAEKINYFADGDFENGTGVDIVFSHPTWTNIEADYYEYVTETTSGVKPVSGERMLSVQANGHYSNIMVPNLKPQTEYTLSFWMYLEHNSVFNMLSVMPYLYQRGLRLEQSNKGATYIKYQPFDSGKAVSITDGLAYWLGTKQPSGQWRKYELQFNSSNTDRNYLHISASILGIPYYIDDLRLTEGTSGYSDTLVNGDFSDKSTSNGWLTDYREQNDNGNKYASVSGMLKQNLKLKDTRGYTLSFRAKSSEGAKLLYGFTNGGTDRLTTKNALSNVSHATATLTSDWQTYTLDFSTLNDQFVSLYFDSQNGKSFDIDDVTLTRATDTVPVEQFTFEESENRYPFMKNRGIAGTVANNADWYEYSNEEAHNGSFSLKMKGQNGNFVSHKLIQDWTTLSLFTGRTYKMSFFASGTAGEQFRFRVMTTDGNWVSDALIDSVETLGDGWNKYEYYFTVDAIQFSNGKQVEFSIDGVDGKSLSPIYFDDFYIEESERSVYSHTASMLYTQDLSQNYFENYNFEKDGDVFENYVKSGDAFFGERYITVNEGDRIVLPVTTRTDITYPFYAQYTFAASLRSNSSAQGIVSLAFDKDGKKLLKDKDGKEANLFTDTNGEWKRSGFSFYDTNETTLYLVIECDKGSFSIDYLSLFNRLREYETNQHDLTEYHFDASNPENYVDAGSFKGENLLIGTLNGLPEGSKMILSGAENYESAINALGEYSIRNIKNGTYNMLVAVADAKYPTMWGSVTFKDGYASGLALTRLNGSVIKITGQGVSDGVARIDDTDTDYGYLTATDDDGYFTAYILDSNWAVIGTTRDTAMLNKYSLKFAGIEAAEMAVVPDVVSESTNLTPILVIIITLAAVLAAAAAPRKKGERF